jgi:hypothetical protein
MRHPAWGKTDALGLLPLPHEQPGPSTAMAAVMFAASPSALSTAPPRSLPSITVKVTGPSGRITAWAPAGQHATPQLSHLTLI